MDHVDLEVIHLLLNEDDRRDLEREVHSAGVESIPELPHDKTVKLIEKFSKKAVLRDLKPLMDLDPIKG